MADIQFPVGIVTQSVVKPNFEVYYPWVVGLKNPFTQQNINNDTFNYTKSHRTI